MKRSFDCNSVSSSRVSCFGKGSAHSRWVLLGISGATTGLVCGVLGLEVGADIFGNYFPGVASGATTGWEVGGQLGLASGFATGAVVGAASAYYAMRRLGRSRGGEGERQEYGG